MVLSCLVVFNFNFTRNLFNYCVTKNELSKQIVKILRSFSVLFVYNFELMKKILKTAKTTKIREKTTVLSSLTVFNFVFTEKITKRFFVRKFLFCFDFELSTKKKSLSRSTLLKLYYYFSVLTPLNFPDFCL